MPRLSHITPDLAVAGALTADDFAELARLGYRAVINNRPDGEEPGQLTGRREANLAQAAGLDYRHIPASKLELFAEATVDAMRVALAELDGPVVAHCKSGLRSAILWAAATASDEGTDAVIAAAQSAGIDLEPVRDEIAEAAGGTAPARGDGLDNQAAA